MWFAILITVLAAAGNNIGKVLQKQATRTLPRLVLKKDIILQYLRSKIWTFGMLIDLAGALLMVFAFALAPVSVVQPVSAIGLVILVVFSHFYLKERLRPFEWVAAAVSVLGVLGLGWSAEPHHLEHPNVSGGHIVFSFTILLFILGASVWLRHREGSTTASAPYHSQHFPGVMRGSISPAAQQRDSMLCGVEAGACFGLSAAACRTGFILAAKLTWMWIPLGLGTSTLLTSSGFVLQTRGLKNGNTVIVCTMAALASMVSGIVAGIWALHEPLPSNNAMVGTRIASWAAILGGVTGMAGGGAGWKLLARTLMNSCYLPAWAWRVLPRPVSTILRRMAKAAADADDDELSDGVNLPLVEVPAAVSSGGMRHSEPSRADGITLV